jgi:hypothetical protein
MRARASIALFLPLACLLGCTYPFTPQPYTNWQIEPGTAITYPPPFADNLSGSMQIQGSQVTGTFTNDVNFQGPPIDVTGSFDSSTGSLTFGAYIDLDPYLYAGAQLTLPPDPTTTLATGIFYYGCPPPTAGSASCPINSPGVPAVAVEIAPLNGTYSGTLTESASSLASPIPSGSVSLTLTQSTIPSFFEFRLTGTLTFTGGGCSTSSTISPIVSGITITNIPPQGPDQIMQPMPPVVIIAYTNPTATQITVTSLSVDPSPCSTVVLSSTTFTGTLTRQ